MVRDGVVFDRLAEVYDASEVQFFKPVARELLRRLDVRQGEHVLDIGCGRGAVLFPAAEAAGPGGRVVGVDVSPAMVGSIAERVAALPSVEVLVMDGSRPDFPDRSFDVVTGSMSVALFPDLPAVLARCARLLRPSGRLGVTAPVPPPSLADWRLGPLRVGRIVEEIDVDAAAANPALARFFGPHPFGRPGEIGDLLTAAGLTDVVEHRQDVELAATTADRIVEWTRSNGLRLFWDLVPEHRRAAVERDLVRDLEAGASAGRVTASYPVSYHLARSPGEE
ncbi:class I SAM-dependent methyltransferase [Actinosynnema pretiosum]|uniref:Methyltransferase n=1 Tax=Actinosynnema pretiosum TaxID=42197 RepID=A0A290Z666_9PSEU|nr:class I SAM-dependent methyltransferase [Actinosynnema pretiosum]ATE54488.1 methyltransferase [Actinosynnema pretiosum]